MLFAIFDNIRHLLVGDENFGRDEGELDFERCAALHNATLRCGGRRAVDFSMTCPQTLPGSRTGWEVDLDHLHPSMIESLKRAHSTELPEAESIHNGTSTKCKIFYFLERLVGPHGHETAAYIMMTLKISRPVYDTLYAERSLGFSFLYAPYSSTAEIKAFLNTVA